MNLPTSLGQILALGATAFTVAIFIVGIAHDPRVPKIGKIMMIILLAMIFASIASMF